MNSEDEEDRTVIRPRSAPRTGPPAAGAPSPVPIAAEHAATIAQTSLPAAVPSHHAITLPAGTRLLEFEVQSTIGEGGFGIVYLAWDHSLDRKVALKEYMPSTIAYRAGATEIRARSERHRETFDAGMKSFINEAKLLAQFDHPSLLKVYRFWEANGTAYMVMPFLEGATVRDIVRAMPAPPDEAWILGLLRPVCDALAMLHAVQVYHRDIAPDNILLLADTGRPLLLDFGAARRVIGDMTQALTAILKPGYAPVEQYADMPGVKQGPWTDVYALAAVTHWMILGKTPSPSVGRLFDDPHVPLARSAEGRYSEPFLQAIDRALAVMPDKRTQSVEAFRNDLLGTPPAARAAIADPAPSTPAGALPPAPHGAPATPAEPASRRWLPMAIGSALVVAAAAAALLWTRPSPPLVPDVPSAGSAVPPDAAASAVLAAPAILTASPMAPASVPIEAPATGVAPEAVSPAVTAEVPVAPPVVATPVVAPPVVAPPVKVKTPKVVTLRDADPPVANNGNRDECAKLFQRLSIGDTDQSLIDRIRTLRCR